MNVWLWAAAALTAGLVPLTLAAATARTPDAVVALVAAGTDTTLVLLLLAEGTHSQSFATLALVLALLGFAGAAAFVRFLEEVR